MDSGLLAALGPGMTVVVTCAAAHYIAWAGLRCLSDTYSRGLTIPKGAVPGRVRGSGHMAPTYFCRFPGSTSDGSCGSAFSLPFVRAGLPPPIHVFSLGSPEVVDARHKAG